MSDSDKVELRTIAVLDCKGGGHFLTLTEEFKQKIIEAFRIPLEIINAMEKGIEEELREYIKHSIVTNLDIKRLAAEVTAKKENNRPYYRRYEKRRPQR